LCERWARAFEDGVQLRCLTLSCFTWPASCSAPEVDAFWFASSDASLAFLAESGPFGVPNRSSARTPKSLGSNRDLGLHPRVLELTLRYLRPWPLRIPFLRVDWSFDPSQARACLWFLVTLAFLGVFRPSSGIRARSPVPLGLPHPAPSIHEPLGRPCGPPGSSTVYAFSHRACRVSCRHHSWDSRRYRAHDASMTEAQELPRSGALRCACGCAGGHSSSLPNTSSHLRSGPTTPRANKTFRATRDTPRIAHQGARRATIHSPHT
jgi:hypothetical protein